SITRKWKGDVLDVNYTFGTQGIVKRHQSKLNTAIKDITSLLEGKIQLPYSVLDDAVKNATKALQDEQTQLIFSDNGILAVDKNNLNLVTLFNSAGIGVSKDGGATFGQALTGQGLNVDYVYTGTMLADYIAGGILASLNGYTVFNLNDGHLSMENTEFELGGGAFIKFTDRGNRIQYDELLDGAVRYSGLGVGRGTSNDPYPIVYMGTSTASGGKLSNIDSSWTGVTVITQRAHSEGGYSTLTGDWMIRDKLSYSRAITFDLKGNSPSINLVNAHENEYNIDGLSKLYTRNTFTIQNMFVTSNRPGWMVETQYSGDGSAITVRGTNGYNYQCGSKSSTSNRIQNIYLKNAPNVLSDERLKTDIKIVDLEFAKKFLELNPKRYKKKLTNADLLSGIKGSNPYEFGFIAQEVEGVFDGKDLRFESLVSTGEDGYKSMIYENIHALHHRLLQDINKRLERLENAAAG